MNFNLSSILFASVLILNTPVYGQGTTARPTHPAVPAATTPATPATASPTSAAAASSPLSLGATGDAICVSKETPADQEACIALLRGVSRCQTKVTAMNSALSKARAACQSAGTDINTCIERVSECNAVNSEEAGSAMTSTVNGLVQSLGVSGFSMPASTYRGRCLNSREFKDERREVNSRLDKLKDKTSSLQEKITKTQEDAERDKRKVQDELQELNERFRKEDVENNQNGRRQDEQNQSDAAKAAQAMRSAQTDILRAQGTLAQMIGERTKQLARLTNALIQANCMESLQKLKEGMKAMHSSSANNVITENSRVRNNLKNKYDECLVEAKAQREASRDQFNASIEAAQKDIDNKQQDIKDIQKSLAGHSANTATEAAEKQQSKAQALQERSTRMQTKQQEYQTITEATKQKVTQYQTELQQAKTDLNTASNDLASLGNQAAGDKSPAEANTAYQEYVQARSACSTDCKECRDALKTAPEVSAEGTR